MPLRLKETPYFDSKSSCKTEQIRITGDTHWFLVSYIDRHLLGVFVHPGDLQPSLVPWSKPEHFGAAENTREESECLYGQCVLSIHTNSPERIKLIHTQRSTLELETTGKAIETVLGTIRLFHPLTGSSCLLH